MNKQTDRRRRELKSIIENCERAITRFDKNKQSWSPEKYVELVSWYIEMQIKCVAELIEIEKTA